MFYVYGPSAYLLLRAFSIINVLNKVPVITSLDNPEYNILRYIS